MTIHIPGAPHQGLGEGGATDTWKVILKEGKNLLVARLGALSVDKEEVPRHPAKSNPPAMLVFATGADSRVVNAVHLDV